GALGACCRGGRHGDRAANAYLRDRRLSPSGPSWRSSPAAGRDRPPREGVSMPPEPPSEPPSEQPTLEALTRRLDALERGNRRLRRGLGVVLIGGAGLFLMGQGPERFVAGTVVAQSVETQSLLIRDATGKVRAVLDADTAGPVSLTFSDKEGRERSAIGV